MELKYSRPALLDNGGPQEWLRPHGHTSSGRRYLARIDTYSQTLKNCGYDTHIIQGPLWGERFQGVKPAPARITVLYRQKDRGDKFPGLFVPPPA
jgi:hypothetical protein